MDVRSGLMVVCLLGTACAESVKFADCGKFHFNKYLHAFPSAWILTTSALYVESFIRFWYTNGRGPKSNKLQMQNKGFNRRSCQP